MNVLGKFVNGKDQVTGHAIKLEQLPPDPAPYEGAIVYTANGFYGSDGTQWIQLDQIQGFNFVPFPVSETAPGEQGQAAWNGEYLAICVATDTWVFVYPARVAP